MRRLHLILLVLIAAGASAHGQDGYPIAGVKPGQRPEGAPVIREVIRDQGWESRFYQGIAKPVPKLPSAGEQGAWYTPFNRPGMPPPYDIRDWHQSKGRNL